jgi:hypothetical protein
MRTLFQILLVVIVSAHCQGQPVSIRNEFLPLWYQNESNQVCSVQLRGLRSPLVEVKHNCAVTMEHEIVPTTNGQANVCLTVDLRKAENQVIIEVFGLDTSGQLRTLEQEVRYHTSLVPFRVQTVVSGKRFALANLTTAPFQVERSEGVTFEGTNAAALIGTFRSGAFIVLKNHGEIRLKQNDQ